MQVEIHEKENLEETQIVIYCWKIDEKVRKVESCIKQLSVVIHVVSDGGICRISADDI